MKECNIKLYDKNKKILNYNIIISFDYDNESYIIYTDNTFDEDGNFNLYGAKINEKNMLEEIVDVDAITIINNLIKEYKNKIKTGDN